MTDPPSRRELEEDARIDGEVDSERESFDSTYSPEIEGCVAVCDLCGLGTDHEHSPEEYGFPEPDDLFDVLMCLDPNWGYYREPVQVALFVYIGDVLYVLGVAYE
jgi:hypothetical protein